MMLDEIDKLGTRLPRRPRGGAARGARPRAEQHLHAITIWTCRSTSRRSSSSPPRTSSTPCRRRCATAWRSSSCPGYTCEEKIHIAEQPPGPEAAQGARADRGDQSQIDDAALRKIIDAATRARRACAGWSGASPHLLPRRCARATSREGDRKREARPSSRRHAGDVILGPRTLLPRRSAERTEVPGIATGLAWTPVGGDLALHRGHARCRARAS